MSERALVDAALDALDHLPEVDVESVSIEPRAGDGRRPDALARVVVRGHPVDVVIEAKSSGYPRDVRGALDQLRAYQQALEGEHAAFVVAPALSAASRALLRESGVSYWDESGSLYFAPPQALYFVERPRTRGLPAQAKSVYRGSASQVLHALLLEPDRRWSVTEMAEKSEVAPATVYRVFTFLESQLWVVSEGAGPRTTRRLIEPGMLLDAWADAYSLDRYDIRPFYRWTRSYKQLELDTTSLLQERGISYALTMTSGASHVAPHASSVGAVACLVPDSPLLARISNPDRGLEPVSAGENVLFLVARDRSPLMFRQWIDDRVVASNVQLYLDLYVWPERGREQALHLRAERLGY